MQLFLERWFLPRQLICRFTLKLSGEKRHLLTVQIVVVAEALSANYGSQSCKSLRFNSLNGPLVQCGEAV
jgi:hypothetical protein